MAYGSRRVGATVVFLGALVSCGTGSGTAGATAPEPSARTADAGTPAPGRLTDSPVSRCRTAELTAAVGRMDPGAGQRNFPVVLTNVSSRTCTLYGYPGAAFVDAAGERLGRDPKRTPATR
ncbi:hypothetical protein SHKM778_53300 [Streptomyces sp. KM77-8]|uniref:DUF4232 domain-containing protein n=1 Tax=Streptomyces haneummycinicus TaxID=3074435 RepID=A0AAT9HND0_9ACTN